MSAGASNFKYGEGEMTNKLMINTRRGNGLSVRLKCRLEKGRGKKEKKKEVITTRGIRILSPIHVLTPPDRA